MNIKSNSLCLAAAVSLALFACGGSDEGDGTGSGTGAATVEPSAKGSKLTTEEQKSAKLDSSGVCRTSGGKFADPVFCKASTNQCKDVKDDDQKDGFCRKPDGKFAVAVCCTKLCGGAKLTKDQNGGKFQCRGKTGFVPMACCNAEASGMSEKDASDAEESEDQGADTLGE